MCYWRNGNGSTGEVIYKTQEVTIQPWAESLPPFVSVASAWVFISFKGVSVMFGTGSVVVSFVSIVSVVFLFCGSRSTLQSYVSWDGEKVR